VNPSCLSLSAATAAFSPTKSGILTSTGVVEVAEVDAGVGVAGSVSAGAVGVAAWDGVLFDWARGSRSVSGFPARSPITPHTTHRSRRATPPAARPMMRFRLFLPGGVGGWGYVTQAVWRGHATLCTA
jgi:hypothetical protein